MNSNDTHNNANNFNDPDSAGIARSASRAGNIKVPRRISQTVLNSLKGGVVPRIGLPYITVGRKAEIEALLRDVDIISEGGASFRFIVGRYGSGKSFLLQTDLRVMLFLKLTIVKLFCLKINSYLMMFLVLEIWLKFMPLTLNLKMQIL